MTDPFLQALGERVRALRLRAGLSRKAAAAAAGVSERHLASLELGTGNVSVLLLRQLARALGSSPGALLDGDDGSPERLAIDDLLRGRGDEQLRVARAALEQWLDTASRHRRVALIGLRGAGKSTLGRALAAARGVPFVELSREIERVAGLSMDAIHALSGEAGYRRLERQALETVLTRYAEAVIATPGGLVSEPGTYARLRANCRTVWLRARPEEHMQRVLAQGDLRPMAGSAEAMEDLRRILQTRTPAYALADLVVDTSDREEVRALDELQAALRTLDS